MKRCLAMLWVLAILAAGCVSKSTANARARAAFLAGQQQAMAAQANSTSVWVIGNVRNKMIPWTDDLTLTRALVIADYQGQGDPSEIVIVQNGKTPIFISAAQLFNGFDMPLQAGDRIEVRP